MTKIFYDTEFVDTGNVIALLSIGMVAENGDEYYAVVGDTIATKLAVNHSWLRENVVPFLPVRVHRAPPPAAEDDEDPSWEYDYTWDPEHPDYGHVHSKEQIRTDVRRFILSRRQPELWAYFGAYDHVALAQLFGTMVDLPNGIPMYTHDIMQEWDRIGRPGLPVQPAGLHNALADAFHVRTMHQSLTRNATHHVSASGSIIGPGDIESIMRRVNERLPPRPPEA